MEENSSVRSYVVLLKQDRVEARDRSRLRSQTIARFGDAAASFAQDIQSQVERGQLPGVTGVGRSRSGVLPMVFVTATESGVENLSRDDRVQTISAG